MTFTSSQLWTPELKSRVREQVRGFDDFLKRYGVLVPPERIAPFSISDQPVFNLDPFITPHDPPYDQRKIPVSDRGTDYEIRRLYGHYVFDDLLQAFGTPHNPVSLYIRNESWIYADYFAASSLDCPPPSNLLKGWIAALWQIRKSNLGSDFIDRALMYGSKSPVYDQSLCETLRPNEERSHTVEEWNRYFHSRLKAGVLVVKNAFEDVLTVEKILKSHGLT
jgi:hypothetical protein